MRLLFTVYPQFCTDWKKLAAIRRSVDFTGLCGSLFYECSCHKVSRPVENLFVFYMSTSGNPAALFQVPGGFFFES